MNLRGTDLLLQPLYVWLSLTLLNHPFWILCKVRYAILELRPSQKRSRYHNRVDNAKYQARMDTSVPKTLPSELAKIQPRLNPAVKALNHSPKALIQYTQILRTLHINAILHSKHV